MTDILLIVSAAVFALIVVEVLVPFIEENISDPITWLQTARDQFYQEVYPKGYFFRNDCQYKPNFYYQEKYKQRYIHNQLYCRKLLHSNKVEK